MNFVVVPKRTILSRHRCHLTKIVVLGCLARLDEEFFGLRKAENRQTRTVGEIPFEKFRTESGYAPRFGSRPAEWCHFVKQH